jgi:hypothetical protein
MGYPELLRQMRTTHGLPIDVYADKAGVFFVNAKKQAARTVEEMPAGHPLDKTRFGAIVDKLGVRYERSADNCVCFSRPVSSGL